MNVAKLAERQLFLMKAENLEKRVRAYYAQTQDVDSLIEYGVAILVRSFFCMGSFSELIQDLIQEVFLQLNQLLSCADICPILKTISPQMSGKQ